jgi:hypothetical protein
MFEKKNWVFVIQQHQAQITFKLVLLFNSCHLRELFFSGQILSKGKFVF